MTHDELNAAVRASADLLSGTERHEMYPKRLSRGTDARPAPSVEQPPESMLAAPPTSGRDARGGEPTTCVCGHLQCDHKRRPVPLAFDVVVTYGACILGCGCSTFTPEEGS